MASSIHVLLVEPDAADQQSIHKALRGRDPHFRVTDAPNPRHLPNSLSNGDFDIALVSLDGWSQPFQALESVRSGNLNLPVVVLSHTDQADEAARHGADGFVMKTEQDLNLLPVAIPAVLERAGQRRQQQALAQQLQFSEKRYRLLFENIQEALIVCDADGRIVEANRFAEQLLNRPAPALMGLAFTQCLSHRERRSLDDLSAEQPARVMLKSPEIPVEVHVNALALDQQTVYLITLRDLQRVERLDRGLQALTAASAAMQGALTPLDVFRAASEQLRSVGLILSVFRWLEEDNALIMVHTKLARRVLAYARRLTGIDPMSFHIPVAGSPALQSILASPAPVMLLDSTQVIREMLPDRLKRFAPALRKVLGYDVQFGVRLSLPGRTYGLILAGYYKGQLVEDDRPMIEALASQIQAALERAQRFEMTQARLASNLSELTQLVRVSEQMQLRLPLSDLLEMICRAIHDSLGWERVVIWLRDDHAPPLRPGATYGVPREEWPTLPLPDESIWRKTTHYGLTLFVPSGDPSERAWRPDDQLVVPLEVAGEHLGVLQVDQPASGKRPEPDDLVSLELFANQTAVAIENAQLYAGARERLQQRTEELTALAMLSAIADQSNLRHSLEQALHQVVHISGMDAADIALLDPPTGALLPYVRCGVSDTLWEANRQTPIRVDEGIAGRAFAAGGATTVSNIESDPHVPFREELLRDGIRTVISVGLVGRNPVGVMTLHARAERQLANETLGWLSVAGRQMALSIENTRLIESMRVRHQMAEAIREVNTAVASALDLDAVLTTIFDQTGRVVPYVTAGIFLVEANTLRMIAVRGVDDPAQVSGLTLPHDPHSPGWRAVLGRQVVVVDDVTHEPAWVSQPAWQHVRAWIGAPLIAHNEVIGLLTLDHAQPGIYTPEDERNVALIAQQAAAAIDNARRFAAEHERSDRLHVLNNLGRELIVALDRDMIFRVARDHLWRAFGYPYVDFFLTDWTTGEVSWCLPSGSSVPSVPGEPAQFAFNQGIVGRAAATGRTYLSGDVSSDPYYRALPTRPNTRSEIAVPLHMEERVIGVLNIESDRLNAFSADDVIMLETLAGQIDAALSLAELYHETQRRAGNLSMLFAASQELGSSLDSDQVFGRLAQWAVSAADATSARVYVWDLQAGTGRLLAQYVGPRANAGERQSMIGVEQNLREVPQLIEVMKSRQPAVFTTDETHIDLPLWVTLRRRGVRGALYLPLIVRERLIGCAEVWETGHSRTWSADVIHMCQTIANVAASAIDNARLFEAERHRRAVAETIRELAAVVSSSLDLRLILEALLERASELIPHDAAVVYIAPLPRAGDAVPDELRIEASRGLPRDATPETIHLSPGGLLDTVLRSREVTIRADVSTLADEWPKRAEVRSWLGVPLIVKERAIGALTFDSGSPGRYRREHADIAETIANNAAVAIENARLYQETRQRLAELETLQTVSLELIRSLDVERVSQAIADDALRLLNATAVHLFSLDVESDSLQMLAKSAAPGFEEIGQPTPRRGGLTMRVAHQGKTVVINDPLNDPTWAPVMRAWVRPQAIASLPLNARERVLGVMNVIFHTPHTITDNEVRVLSLLADQAATALENARLFQAEQRRARQLALVNRVGLEVTSILDLDQLAQIVVEEIHSAFGYYHVSLATIEGDMVVWRASVGGDVPDGSPVGLRGPISAGIVGAAATSGEMIVVGDTRLDSRFVMSPEARRTLSEVALPLKARGSVTGVLNVESDRVSAFGEDDLAMLTSLAGQLGVAVENARLYQELAQHAASLETRVAERTADIRREQERTITILNSVADAVLVTDLSGAIVLTNPVAEALLRDDEIGNPPSRLRTWLRELAPASLPPKITLGARTLQATVAFILEDDRRVGHVIVLRDISQMEEVDQMKSQFVTNVSHELRTPLTNIKLYLGLFQKGKPEKREQYLSTLQSEVGRLEGLISDLLDLSRLERDSQTMEQRPMDLVDVLQHVVATLQPQAEAKQQTLRLELDEPRLHLVADRNQMIQVFINLTANAINYTSPEGTIILHGMIAQEENRPWIVVSVQDNGIGISADDRERIFDRFFRGQAEQYGVRGTGLGLAIVKEIVDQHAGRITVESRVDEGSTFTVWLPANGAPSRGADEVRQ
ncbi:MAG TPA: GAF domain-containing protein [Anaerolineae bacterium]